ncbi:MAG: PD-(D/E)XK nuclease family protein, partial [Bacillota bacterium]
RTKAAIDGEKMAAILRFTRKQVRSLGRRIAGGEIKVAPYRRGSERPCTYCEFRAACGFDVLLPGCDYRHLSLKGDKVWECLTEEGPERGETA